LPGFAFGSRAEEQINRKGDNVKSILLCTSIGLLAILGIPGPVIQAQGPKPARYTVTDIGTLGGANSFAYSNNNSGMVAGGANTPGQNDFMAQTAFVWYGGKPIPVGPPGLNSEGSAASANGSVALLTETANLDPNGEDFCEFGTHRQCVAAVWRNGTLTPLRPLKGGNNNMAFFANSMGEVVGTSEIGTPDATCATPFQVRRFEAVKWSPNGVPTPLRPLPNDTVSFAFTNNDVGQAVGMSGLCSNVVMPPFVPGTSAPHAVLWDPSGTPRDLGNPPGGAGNNVAVGINNQGQVTINSVMSDGTAHAFLWAGSLHDLGTYPADAFITVASCCNNINDRGQIVGFSIDSSFNMRALLWEASDKAPIDINTLVPADSPWYLLSPGGINGAGAIAATAVNLNTFEVHAVLATPFTGIGPAARGATKAPTLPENVRRLLEKRSRH
jgi:probable HAF family extracellular repeat protein